MTPLRRSLDRPFVWLAVAFVAYGTLYIFRTSVVIDGVRYFTLADDQMISMRYAENLASGAGLVWNRGGPRVEGFTNLLWVFYMTLFHLARIPRPWISACIQASGLCFLLLNLVVTSRLAAHVSRASGAGMIAASLTAFYVPLDNWAFQGTEVSLLALAITMTTFVAVRNWDSGPQWTLWVIAASLTLIRPDAVVVTIALLLTLVVARPHAWRANCVRGLFIVGAFFAAETALRVWYFGEPLPNTYYLKLTGIPAWMRVSRGSIVMLIFFAQLVPFLWVIVRRGLCRAWLRQHLVLAVMFGAHVAYSIYIGGDAWEWWGGSNRFVAVVMPLFFVMVATSLIGRSPTSAPFRPARTVFATVVLICIANVLAFAMSPVSTPVRRLLLIDSPPQTEQDHNAVRAALRLRDLTDPSATIAVSWAGAIPYFAERPAIDLLGKMDPSIAHQWMHVPEGNQRWVGFVPGHLKWDYAYSIESLRPDIVQAPLWTLPGVSHNDLPALEGDYDALQVVTNWYVRRDSQKVRRDSLPRTE